MGVESTCDAGACIFWAADDLGGASCVLARYNLVGSQPDRLTRWLFDYKIHVQKKRIAEIMRTRNSQGAYSARSLAARPASRTRPH